MGVDVAVSVAKDDNPQSESIRGVMGYLDFPGGESKDGGSLWTGEVNPFMESTFPMAPRFSKRTGNLEVLFNRTKTPDDWFSHIYPHGHGARSSAFFWQGLQRAWSPSFLSFAFGAATSVGTPSFKFIVHPQSSHCP